MIGLIFGESDFPIVILKKIKKKNLKHLVIDLTKAKRFKREKNSYSVSIGQFGKIIRLLKNNKCKKVLFAGNVKKPSLSKIKLDLKGMYYMPSVIRASKFGDAAIIKSIIKILDKENIKVISSIFYNPELSQKTGNYTKLKPNKMDLQSIKKGIAHFNKLNNLDHVQALIVKKNQVIASESYKGTKKMFSKLKKKSDGILIKFPKNKQDLRIDLPTIGLHTLKDCKKYGLKGIVLKSNRNIFLDKDQSIIFANKNKIFIKVI